MAKRRPKRPQPFIPKQDRPQVSTLLDRPIRDLTPRELATAMQALGIASGPAAEPLSAEALVTLPSDLVEQSFEIALREALPESLFRELAKYGVPEELIQTAPPDTLLAELPRYGVPDRLIQLLKGRLKDLWDAKRWLDKAIRDGKPRVDKAIRDNKARIDKWILDKKGGPQGPVRHQGDQGLHRRLPRAVRHRTGHDVDGQPLGARGRTTSSVRSHRA